MCGISVILGIASRPDSVAEDLQRMNNTLVHRGPDGEGIKVCSEGPLVVGLGHRRLSIIDLACGQQPMSNEDGMIWITYNGEIYNHEELRRQLEARGHCYKTHSDTETILHAFEEWGPACVNYFRGMFAFAIWDGHNRQLFAARDRLGIKPLYYVATDDTLLISSEIKAILSSGRHPTQLNRQSIPEIMTFGYLAGEATLFRGVKTLLPGHSLIWKDGVVETHLYWDVPMPRSTGKEPDEAEYVEEFTSLFETSVRMRLMSDVPLGLFLSGGLDSSAIAVTMAKQMTEPLQTFSVGFESKYYNEFSFAREVADVVNADHHEICMRPPDLLSTIPKLIWHEDKPIRNASSIALYYVAQLASSRVKVVLSGEGSDELFAGYSRYGATKFNNRWGPYYERYVPRQIRETLRSTLWKWPLPLSIRRKLSHSFLNHSMRPEEIFFDNFHAIFPSRVHEQLFSREFYEENAAVNPYKSSISFYESRDSNNQLDQMLYTDQKTYLVELLMKQDRMSMAASIESRVPFLDHQMVEFAAAVPTSLKLNRQGGKHLLKSSMQQRIPRSILNRRKMGFPVPIAQWLNREFADVVDGVLLSERATNRGIFDRQYIAKLLSNNSRRARDHTDALWTLLNFELWSRIFIDGEPHSSVADELAIRSSREPVTSQYD